MMFSKLSQQGYKLADCQYNLVHIEARDLSPQSDNFLIKIFKCRSCSRIFNGNIYSFKIFTPCHVIAGEHPDDDQLLKSPHEGGGDVPTNLFLYQVNITEDMGSQSDFFCAIIRVFSPILSLSHSVQTYDRCNVQWVKYHLFL